MTNLEKRALYSLVRLHWLQDQTIHVEQWQVEDYKQFSLPELFEQLSKLSIQLDKSTFMAYADGSDSPEEFTDYLIGDRSLTVQEEDRIYLLIFEIWRRIVVGKPCLSVFCHELDDLIFQYDQGQLDNPLELQDAISNFLSILNDNVDAGIEPKDAFQRIAAYCANDLETFLYDFIAEQIEAGLESYSNELLEGFALCFESNKWFALLRARLLNHTNEKQASKLLSQIIEEHLQDKDLEFNLELLSSLSDICTPTLLRQVIEATLPLIRTEEDFQDLLFISGEYFHRLDNEQVENHIQNILKKRHKYKLEGSIHFQDSDIKVFKEIIASH